jgi:hypothetical protein
MFDEWRERRKLKRQLADITRRYTPRLKAASEENREAIEGERESEMVSPYILLELLETERLLKKVRKLGIDYKYDQTWWAENEITEQSWLNNRGHAKLRKLIRDERFNIAGQWVKILVPVLTALMGLLGLLVALVTVLRK